MSRSGYFYLDLLLAELFKFYLDYFSNVMFMIFCSKVFLAKAELTAWSQTPFKLVQ